MSNPAVRPFNSIFINKADYGVGSELKTRINREAPLVTLLTAPTDTVFAVDAKDTRGEITNTTQVTIKDSGYYLVTAQARITTANTSTTGTILVSGVTESQIGRVSGPCLVADALLYSGMTKLITGDVISVKATSNNNDAVANVFLNILWLSAL